MRADPDASSSRRFARSTNPRDTVQSLRLDKKQERAFIDLLKAENAEWRRRCGYYEQAYLIERERYLAERDRCDGLRSVLAELGITGSFQKKGQRSPRVSKCQSKLTTARHSMSQVVEQPSAITHSSLVHSAFEPSSQAGPSTLGVQSQQVQGYQPFPNTQPFSQQLPGPLSSLPGPLSSSSGDFRYQQQQQQLMQQPLANTNDGQPFIPSELSSKEHSQYPRDPA